MLIFTTDRGSNIEMVNGRSIRTWEESRGNKTLTRKFYLKYMVVSIVNGKMTTHTFDTIKEASLKRNEIMESIANKGGFRNWINMSDRTPITHMECFGFAKTFGGKVNAEIYVTRESGDLISEVIE